MSKSKVVKFKERVRIDWDGVLGPKNGRRVVHGSR